MSFFQQINLAKDKFVLVKPKRKVHTDVTKVILNADCLVIADKCIVLLCQEQSLKSLKRFQFLRQSIREEFTTFST